MGWWTRRAAHNSGGLAGTALSRFESPTATSHSSILTWGLFCLLRAVNAFAIIYNPPDAGGQIAETKTLMHPQALDTTQVDERVLALYAIGMTSLGANFLGAKWSGVLAGLA
jgi:hypothetical protein